jgi:ornithine carbamoyltransferase
MDEYKKVFLSDVIISIEFRIVKHREYIEKHEQVIKDNVDCVNIVSEYVDMIKERNAKIDELHEFIKYSLEF